MSSFGSKKKGKEADASSCKYLHVNTFCKYSLPNPQHICSFMSKFGSCSLTSNWKQTIPPIPPHGDMSYCIIENGLNLNFSLPVNELESCFWAIYHIINYVSSKWRVIMSELQTTHELYTVMNTHIVSLTLCNIFLK